MAGGHVGAQAFIMDYGSNQSITSVSWFILQTLDISWYRFIAPSICISISQNISTISSYVLVWIVLIWLDLYCTDYHMK